MRDDGNQERQTRLIRKEKPAKRPSGLALRANRLNHAARHGRCAQFCEDLENSVLLVHVPQVSASQQLVARVIFASDFLGSKPDRIRHNFGRNYITPS